METTPWFHLKPLREQLRTGNMVELHLYSRINEIIRLTIEMRKLK